MKKTIIISSILFSAISFLMGQETVSKSLSIGYGGGYIMRQDQIFTPFVHSNLSPLAAFLQYEREKKWVHGVEFKLGMYNPSLTKPYTYYWEDGGESYTTFPSSYTMIDLNYYIGKKKALGDAMQFQFGLASINKIQVVPHAYGAFQIFGYFASFSLDLWGGWEYAISDKNLVKIKASLPVISWLARSPYLANDGEFIKNSSSHKPVPTFFAYLADGNLADGGDLQRFDLELGYERTLSDRWSLGVEYNLELLRSYKPLVLTSFRNSLFVVGTWKF